MTLFVVLVMALLLSGCSNSPTAPSSAVTVTPPVSTPAPVTPPVVTTPPVVAAPAFPPNDARFDLTFYRQFVHNALEGPLQPLRRQTEAPRIYLRTIDDSGAAIDSRTLDITAAALINTAGSLTGVFGLAGLERGTDTKQGQRGWITVRWSTLVENVCGRALVGGDLVTLYPKQPGCRCSGNPAALDMATVKHELGHALGYWHTDNRDDLMYAGNFGECDKNPTAREIYHASIAYGRPFGSVAP